MAVIMRDALKPNLLQTIENTPVIVHAGPFGNIAHGCNSIIATKTGLALADIVVTEAGFGSDLGAEKFFDIKCRFGGLNPEVAVLVATVRALKLNGGADKKQLANEDLGALEKGLPNLAAHIANVKQFGVPVIVAVNRFTSDSEKELAMVADFAREQGVRVALNEVWEKGGEGGIEMANEVIAALNAGGSKFAPLYDAKKPIREKIDTIVKKVYGGDGADYTPKAERAIEYLESIGLGETPICMAKTQYSLSDDATKLGRPKGFRIAVNDVYPAAGAGFVVAQAGDIMTMPGLPKEPAAERMAILPNGSITGLF
jgi:formate--tetrahydrofolate ligase